MHRITKCIIVQSCSRHPFDKRRPIFFGTFESQSRDNICSLDWVPSGSLTLSRFHDFERHQFLFTPFNMHLRVLWQILFIWWIVCKMNTNVQSSFIRSYLRLSKKLYFLVSIYYDSQIFFSVIHSCRKRYNIATSFNKPYVACDIIRLNCKSDAIDKQIYCDLFAYLFVLLSDVSFLNLDWDTHEYNIHVKNTRIHRIRLSK